MKTTILTALAILAAPAASGAQSIPRSQPGTVSQMIGKARIEIAYHRPVARGRNLFGGLVPWGRVWSPSSDTAAIFMTSRELNVAGSKLAAGRYSVFAIPARETWTIIFSSAAPVFHLAYPAGKDVLRIRVKPGTGDHMETLAFYFPVVDADSAVLDLHWGTTVVPIPIRAKQ